MYNTVHSAILNCIPKTHKEEIFALYTYVLYVIDYYNNKAYSYLVLKSRSQGTMWTF